MTTKTATDQRQIPQEVEDRAAQAAVKTEALALAIEQIRSDSRREAGRYLEETLAKFGGE